jgi:fucose permease
MYLLLAHFVVFGCIVGVRGVIWTDVLKMLDIGEGRFGSAQLLPFLVSTMLLVQYARIAAWAPSKAIALTGLGLAGVATLALASVTSFWWFLGCLLILGAGTGSLDGALTQASLDWEQAARRRRMNVLHSGFSAGAVFGALGAGAGLGLGWSFRQVLVAQALLCLVVLVMSLPLKYPPTVELEATTEEGGWRTVLGRGSVRALVLICLLSVVVESVIFLWSVIYLRTALGASALLGGAGFALFNAAMFIGRTLNASLVASYGARSSLQLSGVILVLGALLLMATEAISIAMAALALLGLGVAGVFPTVVSATGDVLPGQSGILTGVIMTSAYLAFLLTPPVVGWVAELASLRAAMAIVLVCGAGIVLLASRLARAPAGA